MARALAAEARSVGQPEVQKVLARIFSYGAPVVFSVPGSPAEAALRLSDAIAQRSGSVVLGSVSTDKVELRARHALIFNSFAPVFRGFFENVGAGTVLSGQFIVHPFARRFMYFAIGFLVCWIFAVGILLLLAAAVLALLPGDAAALWSGLGGGLEAVISAAGMLAASVGFIFAGKLLGARDVAAISEFLASRIGAAAQGAAADRRGPRCDPPG